MAIDCVQLGRTGWWVLDSYSGSNWNRLDSLVIGSGYRRRITLDVLSVKEFFFFLYSRLGGGLVFCPF